MENFKFIKKFNKSNFIQFSPKNNYILCTAGNQIIIIDATTLETIHVFKQIKFGGKVAFATGDEKKIAVQSSIKKLGVFDIENMSVSNIYKMTNSDEPQDCNVSFSPDNTKIIAGIYSGMHNTISQLDLKTSEVRDLKILQNAFVTKIEYFHADNTYLFSIFEREGLLINGDKYSVAYILKWKYPFDINNPLKIKTDLVQTWMDISYNYVNKQYSLYDGDNQCLIITDEALYKEVGRYKICDNCSGYFCNLNWSPNGEFIVITFLNSVKIISSRTMECVKDFKISQGFYSEFSNDNKFILIGTMGAGYLIDMNEVTSK